MKRGQLEDAKQHLVESQRIYKNLLHLPKNKKFHFEASCPHLSLGTVYQKENNLVEARKSLEKALYMRTELCVHEDQVGIAQCKAALGDFLVRHGCKDDLPYSQKLLQDAIRSYT